MNSLYTLGVRQTNSIQADLERLRTGDASASLLGLSVILILPFCDTLELWAMTISCGRSRDDAFGFERTWAANYSASLFVFG